MMRVALAFAALTAFGTAGAALAEGAASTVSGTVQSIDETSRTVVLDNGQSYTLDESANVGSLMEGSHVNLSCESAGAGCTVMEPGASDGAGSDGQSTTPTESEPTDSTTQQ